MIETNKVNLKAPYNSHEQSIYNQILETPTYEWREEISCFQRNISNFDIHKIIIPVKYGEIAISNSKSLITTSTPFLLGMGVMSTSTSQYNDDYRLEINNMQGTLSYKCSDVLFNNVKNRLDPEIYNEKNKATQLLSDIPINIKNFNWEKITEDIYIAEHDKLRIALETTKQIGFLQKNTIYSITVKSLRLDSVQITESGEFVERLYRDVSNLCF